MDLFSDLPEPTSDSSHKPSLAEGRFQGFSPMPSGTGGQGLFGDLPPTSSHSGGEKRKYEETTENGTSAEGCGHKRQNTALYRMRGYLAERKGEREEMQDSHYMNNDFTTEIPNLDPSVCRVSFYGLYDGHGGARASSYAAHNLYKHIGQRFPKGGMANIEKDMKRCLIDAFKKTDDEFLKLATRNRPAWKDGTTAVSLLTVNNTLYISNLGDSKAVLCRQVLNSDRFVAVPLTQDHSPLQYEERMRIQKAGGQVRDGRVMGQLEVSRSLGDGPFKKLGVSSIPDVKKCLLTESDRYILIACDGLWKRFDNESAIAYVNNILSDTDVEATETKTAEDIKFETATNRLASEAVRRLSADNVTVILIAISHPK